MRVKKRDGNYEDVSFDKVIRRIKNHSNDLKNLDPKQVLERGYSIAFNKESNKIIRSSKMLSNGERFYLKTGSGSLEAEKLSDINS